MTTKHFPGPSGETLSIKFSAYKAGQLHVQLFDRGEPYCTLSVPSQSPVHLAPGEFLAKTWQENEEVVESALKSGFFEDTGHRVPMNFNEAQIWRLRPDQDLAGKGYSECLADLLHHNLYGEPT